MYKKYIKRLLDIILSLIGMIISLPIFLIIGLLVLIFLGSPAIFRQKRPGKDEKIFTLYKFRTMTNKKDAEGNLLPDKQRLTKFGRFLRKTSLDEIPEFLNIFKGDMSFIGPRPLAVSYLPYYTAEEHHRHDVLPGLTGLAQVKGRNNLKWEEKFKYDLEYVHNVTFINDVKIMLETIKTVLKHEGIGQGAEKPVSLSKEREKMQNLKGKKLLVIGIEENETIVRMAHEMGVYVILIDRSAKTINTLAKELADEIWEMDYSDIDNVAKRCKKENVQGVIAGYSEFKVLFAAKISEKINRPFYATPEQIEITRNKRKFKDLCIKYGVPIPKDYCFSKFTSEAEMKKVKYPLIVKPTDYAGRKGISISHNYEELKESIEYALKYSESNTIICEEYLKGTEIMAIYTLSNGEISLSSLGEKYICQDHDGIAGLCDCAILPSKYLDLYLKTVDKSLRRLMKGIDMKNGVAFFQGIATDNDIKIFEMGYRLNGNNDCLTIEKYNNINYMKMLISYSLTGDMGDDLKKDNPRFNKILCTLSTYLNSGIVDTINYDKLVGHKNIDNIYSYIYKGKEITDEDTSQRRGIYVKINADTMDELKKTIKYVQKNITVKDTNGNNMLFKPFDVNRLS